MSSKLTRRSFLKAAGGVAGSLAGLYALSGEMYSQETTLSLLTSETDPDSMKFLNQLISEFEKENPGVKVEPEFLSFDTIYQRVVSGIAAGSPPDVMGVNSNFAASMAVKDQLDPVTEVVEELGVENIVSRLTYGGEDWYVPYAINPIFFLIVREDLIKKTGLLVPQLWDEYLELAKALMDLPEDIYATALPLAKSEVGPIEIQRHLLQNRAHLFSMRNGEIEVVINKEPHLTKAIETYKYLKELASYGPPGIINYGTKDLTMAYYGKKVATTYYNGRCINLVNQYAPDIEDVTSYHIDPWPKGGRCEITRFSDGWAIPKGAPNRDLTLKLIKKLVTGDAYIDFLHTVPIHLVPPNRMILDSKRFWDNPMMKKHPDIAALLYYQAFTAFEEQEVDGFVNPFIGDIFGSGTLEESLQKVVLDKATPKASIDELARKLDNIIAGAKKRVKPDLLKDAVSTVNEPTLLAEARGEL